MSGNIYFIGRSFHKFSKSADFFIDKIEEFFGKVIIKIYPEEVEIEKFTLEQMKKGYVFVWQNEPYSASLSAMGIKVINISMYDGVENLNDCFWEYLRSTVQLSFCKELHSKLINKGFNSIYAKRKVNYQKIQNYKDNSRLKIFFWERLFDYLSFEDISNWINTFPKQHDINLHVHFKNQKRLNEALILHKNKNYSFELSTSKENIENNDNYFKKLTESDVFICPRPTEGIGQSLIEALRLGLVAISSDKPTANEYIKKDLNGILYKENIKEISYKKIMDLLKNRKNTWEKLRLSEDDYRFEKSDLDNAILKSIKVLNEQNPIIGEEYHLDSKKILEIIKEPWNVDQSISIMNNS